MSVSPQNRAKFEKMGVAFVRLDIAMGQFIESNADQKEAFEWVNEQETRARKSSARQFWAMIILTANRSRRCVYCCLAGPQGLSALPGRSRMEAQGVEVMKLIAPTNAIEKIIDPAAPPEERAQRRRRLTKGPLEFREDRVDLPKAKGK
jgi:hypothetical protein